MVNAAFENGLRGGVFGAAGSGIKESSFRAVPEDAERERWGRVRGTVVGVVRREKHQPPAGLAVEPWRRRFFAGEVACPGSGFAGACEGGLGGGSAESFRPQ